MSMFTWVYNCQTISWHTVVQFSKWIGKWMGNGKWKLVDILQGRRLHFHLYDLESDIGVTNSKTLFLFLRFCIYCVVLYYRHIKWDIVAFEAVSVEAMSVSLPLFWTKPSWLLDIPTMPMIKQLGVG